MVTVPYMLARALPFVALLPENVDPVIVRFDPMLATSPPPNPSPKAVFPTKSSLSATEVKLLALSAPPRLAAVLFAKVTPERVTLPLKSSAPPRFAPVLALSANIAPLTPVIVAALLTE